MKKVLIILFASIILAPQIALATSVFNFHLIISDDNLTNDGTMSVTHIQRFLTSKGNLGSYSTTDPNGITKTAAQIIYDAAKTWHINPQYLIVRMQIEQSLITTSSLTQNRLDWATGYGVCDSCSKDDPSVQQFMGFYNQVNWAARRVRESYLSDLESRGYTLSGWGPGITKVTGDGYAVTPVNNATAALYTYTPYVYNANYNIWTYWNNWFTKQFPDGSLVQVQGKPAVYYIQNGKKRLIASRSVLASRFNPSAILQISQNELDAYDEGVIIKFANYSLISSKETKRMYLIDGDQKRYIISPKVFRAIGFNPEEVVKASEADLSNYQEGDNIDMTSAYPTGTLFQDKKNGGIWYVKDNIKHAIVAKEILKARFGDRKAVKVSTAELDKYPKGDPITFNEGQLVVIKGKPEIYVVSNGLRRHIKSLETFNALGFKLSNVIKTSEKAVNILPLGEPIDINFDL